jgi:lipoate---protein ligase
MPPLLRILDTGLMPPRWNVAMTAALAELRARDAAGSADPQLRLGLRASLTVRFHRYPACVLLGASQDMESAADVAYCRAAGIEIARRVTGGGAVFMSPEMLAWDVLVDRRAFGEDLAAVTERICGGVAAGLSRLGAAARFQRPNDTQIGGRKVSGSAGYVAGRGAMLQGTVLIGDDVPAMERALRLREGQLRERVTCLAAELGAPPALPAVVDCITLGLAEALGREPMPSRPRDDELALCDKLLREEIGTDAYVAGRAAAPA